jgi:hypothetical protein
MPFASGTENRKELETADAGALGVAAADVSASQAVFAFPLGMMPRETSRFTSPAPESPSETGAVSAQRNVVEVDMLPLVDVATPLPGFPPDVEPCGVVVVPAESLPPPDEPLPQFKHTPPPATGAVLDDPEPL